MIVPTLRVTTTLAEYHNQGRDSSDRQPAATHITGLVLALRLDYFLYTKSDLFVPKLCNRLTNKQVYLTQDNGHFRTDNRLRWEFHVLNQTFVNTT